MMMYTLEQANKQVLVNEEGAAAGVPVRARLKWFNNPKGFGFVIPEGREDIDAFLHITTLQKAEITALGEGACLSCHIQYGAKGAHVTYVDELIEPGAEPKPLMSADAMNGENGAEVYEMGGVVKWYNPDKEFGFIVPDDGKKDVFIHRTCLEKHNIDFLTAGQRVAMRFRTVPKGREVITMTIEDSTH